MKTEILVAFMILLIVGQPVAQFLLKKRYQNKIYACFKHRDYEGLENILNNKTVKFTFTPFNIEYCRLNGAIMRDDKKAVNRQFDVLLDMKLNEHQKQDVCLNGFNYYLSVNDQKRTDKFYKLSKSLKNEEIKKNIDISYNILFEKGYTYLDDILKLYENCAEEEKYINEYLLSIMYKNKGDHERSKHFEELAKAHEREFAGK